MKKIIILILLLFTYSINFSQNVKETITRTETKTTLFGGSVNIPSGTLITFKDTNVLFRTNHILLTTQSVKTAIDSNWISQTIGGGGTSSGTATLQTVTDADSITTNGARFGESVIINHSRDGGNGFVSSVSGNNSIGIRALSPFFTSNNIALDVQANGYASYPLKLRSMFSDTVSLVFNITNNIVQKTSLDGSIIAPYLTTGGINTRGAKAFTTKEYVDSIKTTNTLQTVTDNDSNTTKGAKFGGRVYIENNYKNDFGLYSVALQDSSRSVWARASSKYSTALFATTQNEKSIGVYATNTGLWSIPMIINQSQAQTDTNAIFRRSNIDKLIFRSSGGIIAPDLQTTDITALGNKTLTTKEYVDSVKNTAVFDTTTIYKNLGAKLDSNIFYNQDTLIHEPTGFSNNSNINVSYDSTTRKITLTGSFTAYHNGRVVPILTNGYESPAHGTTLDKTYYLHYDDVGLKFDTIHWDFDEIQIASVWYSANDKFALIETHGFMQYQTHASIHYGLGTRLVSGGDISGVTLNSATAINRRPDISATLLNDEDLNVLDTAKTNKSYTLRYLTGTTATRTLLKNQTEIIPLSGNQPYWNQLTGGAWQQTLFGNNDYGAIFVIAVPTTNDGGSSRYRYQFIQPQAVSGTLATIQGINTQNIIMGDAASPEYVFIAKIIIRYTATNWQIISVEKITGSRASSVTVTGGFLSTVATDATLTGNGTPASPLSVVSSVWMPTSTATRVTNSTLTITGTDTTFYQKGLIVKWLESGARRCGMISTASTVSTGVITLTIIGDTIAPTGIDNNSFRYSTIPATIARFAIAGTIGATGTDVANAYYANEVVRVLGADIQTGTAGTTNNTTVDINKNGTTLFSTKPTLATTVAASTSVFTAMANFSLAMNDKMTLDIDQVQTTPCQDLYVQVYLFPQRILNMQ